MLKSNVIDELNKKIEEEKRNIRKKEVLLKFLLEELEKLKEE